jgi:hypothetical protein
MKRIVFVILAMLLGNVYCQEIGYITLFQSAIQDSMVECGKIESNIEFVDSIVNLECDAFDGTNTTIYIKKSNIPLFFWGLAKNIYNVADNVKICIQHQPCCGDNIIYYLWVNLERNQNKLDTVVTYYFTDTKIPNPEIWEISRRHIAQKRAGAFDSRPCGVTPTCRRRAPPFLRRGGECSPESSGCSGRWCGRFCP